MLLVLTGDIQIGKTRWLRECIGRLEAAGVACEGVLAPGVWRPYAQAPRDDVPGREDLTRGGDYEKLGIDNELLPGHELVPFARRQDLARAEGTFSDQNQAAKVGMGWHIDDRAVARVNGHFDLLESRIAAWQAAGGTPRAPRVLFVDELGRLELLFDGGITSAMGLLGRGPRGYYEHAVVIARDKFGLKERTAELFGDVWGGAEFVAPGELAWLRWFEPLLARA